MRLAPLLAAAGILAGLALLLAAGGRRAPAEAAEARGPAEPPAAAWRAPPLVRAPAMEAPAAPSTSTEAPRAALHGIVLDATGSPLAGASVGLLLAGAAPQRRGARADADGRFELLGLPPGAWQLEVRHPGPRRRFCTWLWGTAELSAGAGQWLEIRLPGTRAVRGVLRMPDEDGLVLTVLLRRAGEPGAVVARSETVLDAALERREAALLQQGDGAEAADPGILPLTAVSGEFWFGGLAPARYELDVCYDAQARYFVTRSVDLTQGDADLGLETLRFDDFAQAGLERNPALLRAVETEVARQRAAGVEPPRVDVGALKRRLEQDERKPPGGP